MKQPSLILASSSPRRRALLEQVQIDFTVQSADIDETPLSGESPQAYVTRMAKEKAQAVFAQQSDSSVCVLAADTIGICDDAILLKPRHQQDALQMLQTMQGRDHYVVTAIALCFHGQCIQTSEATTVSMRTISSQEIAAYWRTGEPKDKAGAYGIQGIGAQFIERIDGCYFNVVGLPLSATVGLLKQAGIHSLA